MKIQSLSNVNRTLLEQNDPTTLETEHVHACVDEMHINSDRYMLDP